MDNRRLNIIILANGNFPIGMASTNRLVSYCKGIVELGHTVKVIVLSPHEREGDVIINKDVAGVYHGINFIYSSGTTIWPRSTLKKISVLFMGLLNSLFITIKFSRYQKIDALLFASGSTKFRYVFPFFILSRILNTKLIREKSEYPVFMLKPEKFSAAYRFIARRYLFKFFDGLLIMTTPLMDYFGKVVRKNAKLILIPMTVEPKRFSPSGDVLSSIQDNYVAYCGHLWGEKDGVTILLKAFQLVAAKHKDIKLYLIGDTSNLAEFKKLKALTSKLNLENNIVFTGRVSRDDMPKYLCNARALLLSRPTSLQAQGGFPTKLGEYLATGKPVVITKVGDIPKYLKDGKNAFLAEPDDIGSFAEKLDYVLSNPEQARLAGMEGKKLTDGVFNYLTQSKQIVEFLMDW